MSIDLTVFANEEVAVAADLPATLVLPTGAEVKGMADSKSQSQNLGEEGFFEVADLEFRALVSLFPIAPQRDWVVKHKDDANKEYRIKEVKKTADALTYILSCSEKTS